VYIYFLFTSSRFFIYLRFHVSSYINNVLYVEIPFIYNPSHVQSNDEYFDDELKIDPGEIKLYL
jgi:hypothetical protein